MVLNKKKTCKKSIKSRKTKKIKKSKNIFQNGSGNQNAKKHIKKKIAIIGLGSIGLSLLHFLQQGRIKSDNEFEIILFHENKLKITKWHNQGLIVHNIQELNQYDGLQFQYSSSYDELLRLKPDFIIITTKATANKSIAEKIRDSFNYKPIIICAQNGVGNDEEFLICSNKIIRMVITIAANLQNDNTVSINFIKPPQSIGYKIYIKDSHNNNTTGEELLKFITKILNDGGLITKQLSNEDIIFAIWKKAILNCTINALSAVLQLDMQTTKDNKHGIIIIEQIIKECISVAINLNPNLKDKLNYKELMDIIMSLGKSFSSMSIDIKNNNMTEIDYLNGYISEKSKELQIPTPYNDLLTYIIKMFEDKNKVSISMPKISYTMNDMCRIEQDFIKELLSNENLKKVVKTALNNIINKLNSIIKVEKKEFLSDDILNIGNIGIDDIDTKFSYLLSETSSIREKINAIMNTIFDSIKKKPKLDNTRLIFEYIKKLIGKSPKSGCIKLP